MEVTLKAEKRDGAGKGVARKIRATGKVPAVLYGPTQEALTLVVGERDLWHALHTDAGTNVLVNLSVDGDSFLTMPREVQRDIVRGTLLHVDFLQIRRDVAIEVDVPVQLVGDSIGVTEGGVIEHHLWELHVECLPTAVPEHIEADITNLAVNDALHVSDVTAPEGVTILTPPEETVVAVVPPPVMELPEEAAAEEVPEGVEGAEEAAEGAAGPGEAEVPPAEGGGEQS